MKHISKILIFTLAFTLSVTPVFAQNTYDNLNIKKLPEFQYKNIDQLLEDSETNMDYLFDFIKAVKKRDWKKVYENQNLFPGHGVDYFRKDKLFPAVLGAFSDSDLKALFEKERTEIPFLDKTNQFRDFSDDFFDSFRDPSNWFFRNSFYRDVLASMGTYSGHYNPYDKRRDHPYSYVDSVRQLNDIKDLKLPPSWKMDIAKRYSIMRFYRIYREVNPDYPEIKFFKKEFKLTPISIGGYENGFNPKKQKYLNFYCNAIYSSDRYLGCNKKIIATIYDSKNKVITTLKPAVSYVGDYLASYTFTLDNKTIKNINYLSNGEYKIKIYFDIFSNKKILNSTSKTSYFRVTRQKPKGRYISMPTYLLDVPIYCSYNYIANRYKGYYNVMSNKSLKNFIKLQNKKQRSYKDDDYAFCYVDLDTGMFFSNHEYIINNYYRDYIFAYTYKPNTDTKLMYQTRAKYMNKMYDAFIHTKIQLMTDSVLFDNRTIDWRQQFSIYGYNKATKMYIYNKYGHKIRGDKLLIMALGIDYQRYPKLFPKYLQVSEFDAG